LFRWASRTAYSAMDNYADFLSGAPMNANSSITDLGVNATRKCIEESGVDPSQIVVNRRDQHPGPDAAVSRSEVMGRTHGLLPRSLSTVSMQFAGMLSMLKSVEVAQWYLAPTPQDGHRADVRSTHAFRRLRSCAMNITAFAKSLGMRKNSKLTTLSSKHNARKRHLVFNRCCLVMARSPCYWARTLRKAATVLVHLVMTESIRSETCR